MEVKLHPEWYQYIQLPESEWSLIDLGLLIAEHIDDNASRQKSLYAIEDMVGALVLKIDPQDMPESRLDKLIHYFSSELGFHGNSDDYFNPDNSLLHKVIASRVGIPISLSILFMRFVEAIGLKTFGIGFPGHFLVGVICNDKQHVIDPFNHAAQLDQKKLVELLAKTSMSVESVKQVEDYLTPISNRQIIVRLLRNLKNIYIDKQEIRHALTVIEMILSLLPDASGEMRDRGMIYHHIGYNLGALTDLQKFIELEPESSERNVIEALIESLGEQTTSLH